ncbi:hypothetical protein CHELA40_14924 [Chelatococcus asaccharovorans]|nr:hypothetical protein CHELA17_60698 [Chelatococcus asaccharovorans]CAH1680790.1 hypothetical protein CHELA40_14924 [Chelatococcus asaccharovorans]
MQRRGTDTRFDRNENAKAARIAAARAAPMRSDLVTLGHWGQQHEPLLLAPARICAGAGPVLPFAK